MRIKRSIIFLASISLLSVFQLHGQAPALDWAKSVGGTNLEKSFDVVTDAIGQSYTTGYFEGTVDFDPGSGVSNLTSNGGRDIFIQKLDANGNFLWANSIGSTGNDEGKSLAIDLIGSMIYLTGYFEGSADFDPGTGTSVLSSNGSRDIFIQKFDASGNYVWANSIGSTDFDYGFSIAVSNQVPNNAVCVTGRFKGSVDFDPGAGTATLTSSSGSIDAFILKLDANGNYTWARKLSGAGTSAGNGVIIDVAGNVVTTGYFTNTIDFDPGVAIVNASSNGLDDVFVHKLDASGNFLWVKQMGSSLSDQANDIAVDQSNNIYTTGFFTGTVDFDPNAGITNLVSNGSLDAYVQKLDASGNLSWIKGFGGSGVDRGSSICKNISSSISNVYVSGHFESNMDINPNVAVQTVSSVGGKDMFIQKFDFSGGFIWGESIGTTTDEFGEGVHSNVNDELLATGYFSGTVDFDPSAGISNLTAIGNSDQFIAKYRNCVPSDIPNLMPDITICPGSTTFLDVLSGNLNDATDWQWYTGGCGVTNIGNGSSITVSPMVTTAYYVRGEGGCSASGLCDSVFVTVLPVSFSNITESNCDGTYTAPSGAIYTTTGIYTDVITSSAGCDSTITIDLTINSSSSAIVFEDICGSSFISPSGAIYTSSGTYADTISNIAGCDSIITINLTLITVDTLVSQSGNTLSSGNVSASSFQWIDCSTNNAITGETSSTFTTNTSGSYALIISESGCVDTSSCYLITSVGFEEDNLERISLFPNPVIDQLTVVFLKPEVGTMQLLTLDGRLIKEWQVNTKTVQADLRDCVSGTYMLRFKSLTSNNELVKRIVK